jgi:photosystem II stability/assembly factor-like uncharacterized protein
MRISFVLLAALMLAGCGTSNASPSSSTSSASAVRAQNHVHSIVIMPHNPNVLYLGAHYRLYKSDDGGRTWHPLTSQMMLSMALDPGHPSILYAVSSTRGLIKTTDGGAHWYPSGAGIPRSAVTGVALDPQTGTVLAYGVGIYRSVDGGAHWTHLLGHQSMYSVTVSADGTAYAASGNGLSVSHDAGAHWTSVASIGNQPVTQVAAAGHVAYADAAVALMKSANDGATWSTLSKAPQGIEFLGASPSDPNEVFGEIGDRGFVASYDGGKTWHSANSGIKDRNFNASTIRVAPSSPNVVYTGSWGLHFYASDNAGRHWTEVASLTK